MLTNSDLQKVGDLIDRKVTAIVDERVPAIINQSVPAIINQSVPAIINQSVPAIINQLVPNIISKSVPAIIKKELKPIERRLTKIEKVIREDFDFLDRLHIKSAKAINRLESNVGISRTDLMLPKLSQKRSPVGN